MCNLFNFGYWLNYFYLYIIGNLPKNIDAQENDYGFFIYFED